jgi:hypothetical protein
MEAPVQAAHRYALSRPAKSGPAPESVRLARLSGIGCVGRPQVLEDEDEPDRRRENGQEHDHRKCLSAPPTRFAGCRPWLIGSTTTRSASGMSAVACCRASHVLKESEARLASETALA